MKLDWEYCEAQELKRLLKKAKISRQVHEFIKRWVTDFDNSITRGSRQERIYVSPNQRCELWDVRFPNPDSNKGKSGGYRSLFVLDYIENTLTHCFIADRNEMDKAHISNDYHNRIAIIKKELGQLDS